MKHTLKHYLNSFSGRILLIVALGFIIAALILTFVVLTMSQSVFIKTYGQSQEKVIDQIENEFTTLHEELLGVIDAIDSSWAFRLYLTDHSSTDNVQMFQTIYQMEHDLVQSVPNSIESLNVVVIGMNGAHYLSRTETISKTQEEILQSAAARAAFEKPETVHYTFLQGGFTMTTKNRNVLMVSKALYYPESMDIYGLVFITLTQDDLRNLYDYFITDNSSFYLINAQDTIISCDNPEKIGSDIKEDWYQFAKQSAGGSPETYSTQALTVLKRELPYQNASLYGVVDNQLAIYQLYDIPFLIFICMIISAFLLAFVMLCAQKTLAPLSRMAEKMTQVRNGNFTEYVPVVGTTEIQEVASTYNRMLDALQNYIQELVETQKKQRQYEIKALQMQINPHYIYNTLASIKMLIYQNAQDKTISTIDAFIALLRNTIANTDEMITIQQELENLRNYVLITHTRYGESVQAEYYVSSNCYHCLIPKMILQPFIENAFFHAFPSGRKGTIQVLISKREEHLIIRIIDDGVGMQQQKANRLIEQGIKKEYFSGIGIHNVHDRLRLLFGEEYGVQIVSEVQQGTTVIITLPLKEEKDEDSPYETN